MEISNQAHTAVAGWIELKSFGLQSEPDEEFDRDFREFIDSITLSREEFAAFLAIPKSSVPEIKRLFAGRQSPVAGTD